MQRRTAALAANTNAGQVCTDVLQPYLAGSTNGGTQEQKDAMEPQANVSGKIPWKKLISHFVSRQISLPIAELENVKAKGPEVGDVLDVFDST